jgi:hypothetical protein
MLQIKIHGATPTSGKSICTTCKKATLVKGQNCQEVVMCHLWSETRSARIVPFKIAECGGYHPSNMPYLHEMEYDKGYFGEDTLFWANQKAVTKTTLLLKNQARAFYSRLADKYPAMRTWKGVWLDRLAEPEKTSVFMPDWLEWLVTAQPSLPVLAKE